MTRHVSAAAAAGRFVATVILVAGGLAAGASAHDPPPQPAGDDIVGIYMGDGTGPWSWVHYEGSGPQVTVYIVLTGLTQPGIAGWELAVGQEGSGVMFLSATLLGEGATNPLAAPAFQVTLDAPMTAPVGDQGAWPVASMLYFVTATAPTRLSIGPVEPTSFPEAPGPGYESSAPEGLLVRAHVAGGEDSGTVFGFNDCPLGCLPPLVVTRTWGEVKGLYR